MAGGNVPSGLAPIFEAAGRQYGIPPAVLAGVSSVESDIFRNNGPSRTGAQGGMQFEPTTAAQFHNDPAHNPHDAIFDAAKLLVQYGFHQNPLRAIGAYNGGPGNPQYGYARQVMSEAARLAPQLKGGGAAVSGAGFTQSPVTSTSTTFSGGGTDVNSAGIAALMSAADKPINPSGAFKADHLLSDFASNVASGNYKLPIVANTHMTTSGSSLTSPTLPGNSSHGGGFLPSNAPYTPGRHDQGRDGTTTPGGAILANGDGVVVRVAYDPNGFGPRYPIVKFTSGPDAGKYVYFGHTLAVVRPGDHVHAGQVLSHTGTHGVGNATVPGWFEIGFAPGGVPGRFGQPTPF